MEVTTECEQIRFGEISRRGFLAASAGAAAIQVAQSAHIATGAGSELAVEIVDTHVYLGRWPFRKTPENSAAETIAALRRSNVVHAWAGTFEGLLHKDVSGANARLTEACHREAGEMLVPFGSVNPTLPDWEEDVRRCHELFKMPGVRLHPNYHGYTLADERFVALVGLAAKRKLIVQLVAQLDDEAHAYLRLPASQVDLSPLAVVAQRVPGLRLTLHSRSKQFDAPQVSGLVGATNVYFDTSAIADPGSAPSDRLVFGSCWPLGTMESAAGRAFVPAVSEAEVRAIGRETARRLLRNATSAVEAAE
jgi:uncharacterized protein